jgi:hypothetical protein
MKPFSSCASVIPAPIAQTDGPAQVLESRAHWAGCHVVSLVRATLALYIIPTRSRPFVAFFG